MTVAVSTTPIVTGATGTDAGLAAAHARWSA